MNAFPDRKEQDGGSELRYFEELSQVADEIASPNSFDRNFLREKYLESSGFRYFQKKREKAPIDVMVKEMAELYVASILERNTGIGLDRGQLLSRMSTQYAPKFNYDTYGAYIYKNIGGKTSQHPIAEIDALGLLLNHQTPFAVEVETGKSVKNARSRINGAITEDRIELLSHLFDKSLSFGYLLVVDPSNSVADRSPSQGQFIDNGGIITSFPLRREDFIPYVADIRRSYFEG
jgi:hypothetical protein